jgi:hypothetical protein
VRRPLIALLAGVPWIVGVAAAQPSLPGPAGSIADALGGLSALETAGVVFATILFLGGSLVLVFYDYTDAMIAGTRASPLRTVLLGALGQVAFLGLFGVALFSFIFAFFLIVPLGMVYVAWSAVGFVAIGELVTARIGWSSAGASVFVGAALGTALVFLPVGSLVALLLVSTVGVGAGLGAKVGITTVDTDDRTVPNRRV